MLQITCLSPYRRNAQTTCLSPYRRARCSPQTSVNGVPGTLSETKCLSPYSMQRVRPQTSVATDWNKGQFAGHAGNQGAKTQTTSLSPCLGPHPYNVPGTLFALLGFARVAGDMY
ncbi:MAG: hypothetical protein GX456_06400 [Verrucomicrobia bacterium]|nr:hypothetical protein [Verrucomicrobiota bacterium]